MQTLLTQLPALIGVVVGALATYVSTSTAERARWRRQRTTRWDEARVRAYAEYGNAVKRLIHVSTELAAARGIQHSSDPVEIEEGLRTLNAVEADRTAKWEAVLLLGEAATVAAARAWHEAAWRLEWYARGRISGQAGWEEALSQADAARQVFYHHARADLGVTGGNVPPPRWPPSWLEDIEASAKPSASNQPSRLDDDL
jgi:hypothetical protein